MMALVLELPFNLLLSKEDGPADRHLGTFRIHGSRIGRSAELFDLFSRCIPLTVLPIAAIREVEYLALSAEFDLVPEGNRPPAYAVRFSGGRARFDRL